MQIKLKDGTTLDVERVDEVIYNGEPQLTIVFKAGSYTLAETDKSFKNNCDPIEVYSNTGELLDTLTGYIRPRVQKHYENDTITLSVVIFAE